MVPQFEEVSDSHSSEAGAGGAWQAASHVAMTGAAVADRGCSGAASSCSCAAASCSFKSAAAALSCLRHQTKVRTLRGCQRGECLIQNAPAVSLSWELNWQDRMQELSCTAITTAYSLNPT